MFTVIHYLRKPRKNNFSIERLYEDVRRNLPPDIHARKCENKHYSNGIFRRMFDMIRASFLQGEVNHVTGDVHFLTFFLRKKRTILTIHDCGLLYESQGLLKSIYWFFWFWLPEKRCSVITVVSRTTKEQLLQYIRCEKSKIKIIHNCISPEFQPDLKNFESRNPRILQIGTKQNKNIERVADALKDIPCTFVIIGPISEHQREHLKQNEVCFENLQDISRDALLNQYRLCDMLVFASLYEGFGLPIIEANAVGRPVVAGNRGAMLEIAGEAACLVNPESVEDIRNGILKVIRDSDYRERLVASGLENARLFDARLIAGQYASLYRSVHEQVQGD